MSHFAGLVILTPKYLEHHSFEGSLEKFNENLEVDEYCKGKLSDYEKAEFLEWYCFDNHVIDEQHQKMFVKYIRKNIGFETQKQYKENRSGFTYNDYYKYLTYKNQKSFGRFFKKYFPDLFSKFEEEYEKNGESWNGNTWHKDEKGVWCKYSTYNPDSKWDWYANGGRWNNAIKTKSGEFVNECLADEIDLEPYPNECYKDDTDWRGNPIRVLKDEYDWHYTKDDMPFCVVIDGVWYERGQMGWWACVSNEKDKDVWNEEVAKMLAEIPGDSEVYNVDFHI